MRQKPVFFEQLYLFDSVSDKKRVLSDEEFYYERMLYVRSSSEGKADA